MCKIVQTRGRVASWTFKCLQQQMKRLLAKLKNFSPKLKVWEIFRCGALFSIIKVVGNSVVLDAAILDIGEKACSCVHLSI